MHVWMISFLLTSGAKVTNVLNCRQTLGRIFKQSWNYSWKEKWRSAWDYKLWFIPLGDSRSFLREKYKIQSKVPFHYWLVLQAQLQAKSLVVKMLMTDSFLIKSLWTDLQDLTTVGVQSSPLIRSCVLLIVNKAMIIGRLVQVLLLEHINDKEWILYTYIICSWPA